MTFTTDKKILGAGIVRDGTFFVLEGDRKFGNTFKNLVLTNNSGNVNLVIFRTRCQIPDDDEVEGLCQKFEEAGEDEIYVTPMVPFILPMAVSLILVLLVGDPLLSVLC